MARLLMLSLLLFLFGLPVQADGFRQRPSPEAFDHSIEQHIERLPIHGERLFLGRRQHFKALGSLPLATALWLIRYRFSLHDFVKLASLERLRKLGYKGNRTFRDQLYEIWGKKIRPPFVDEMNEIEHRQIAEQMRAVLEELGIDPVLRAMILEDLDILELSTDVIDTKWHRGKELDFEYHLYDAAKFLAERKHLEAADLARWYESTYYFHQGGGRACYSAHP